MLIDLCYLIKSYFEKKRLLNHLLKECNYPTGDKKKDKEIYSICEKKAMEFLLNCKDF